MLCWELAQALAGAPNEVFMLYWYKIWYNWHLCLFFDRAAEWSLDAPDWTGRMRVVAMQKQLSIKLEDKNSGVVVFLKLKYYILLLSIYHSYCLHFVCLTSCSLCCYSCFNRRVVCKCPYWRVPWNSSGTSARFQSILRNTDKRPERLVLKHIACFQSKIVWKVLLLNLLCFRSESIYWHRFRGPRWCFWSQRRPARSF